MERLTIPNFTPIPFNLTHSFIVEHVFFGTTCNHKIRSIIFKFVKEELPDLLSVFFSQVLISNNHVDSRNEGIVEVTDSIGCEKKNTSVILQAT